MRRFVSFNRRIVPAEKAFLTAASAAALYGGGVFTTVAVYRATAFLWEKHWARLIENAARVGIDLSEFSESETEENLYEVLGKNDLTHGRARLTFFDGAPAAVWRTDALPPPNKTNLLIQTAEARRSPDIYRLTVSPFGINARSALAGVKSCNYLENILALKRAQAEGFDEAIRLNEKAEIAAACLANVFWTKGGALYTPPLKTGCLRGTTRDFLMENFPVKERIAKLSELYRADEILLTSSGIGVVRGKLEI